MTKLNLTDTPTPDGGGRMTQNVIPSGQAGNVFQKVSRIDSVYGRVNLLKIYVAVRTATLEMYAGAHAIITAPPENDRISCCLFSTGSWFDQRSAARDRIESYVVAGPISRMRVYGQQLIGQRAILLYQRPEDPLPDVGEVYVLSVESGAGAGTQQYVRITAVNHELRTFTDNSVASSRCPSAAPCRRPSRVPRYRATAPTHRRPGCAPRRWPTPVNTTVCSPSPKPASWAT